MDTSVTDRATKLASIPIHERFLLDEETASIMCGAVGRNTFRHWVAEGRIKPVRMPCGEKRRLYRRSDVIAFVESMEVAS